MIHRIQKLVLAATLLAMTAAHRAHADDAAAAQPAPQKPEIAKEVLASGEGAVCGKGRAAVVHYTGTLTDGKKFDSSRDRDAPFTFEVGAGSVIEGWDAVVAQMKVGDRWKVTIPWQMAYGADGRPPAIPPRADLVFDIELLAIVEPTHEVVTPGEGAQLAPGQRIEAHIVLSIADGATLKDTRAEKAPATLGVGARSGITGLDMMIKRMRVGDHWKIRIPPALAFGAKGQPPRIPANADVIADVEILRVLEPQIETLVEGDGAQPEQGQIVVVHYTGTLTDGTEFDSSRKRGAPFKFPLGAGRVIPGWDITVAKMHVGERVKVTIPWQLAYGARGMPPTIPAKADLVFDIELLAIE